MQAHKIQFEGNWNPTGAGRYDGNDLDGRKPDEPAWLHAPVEQFEKWLRRRDAKRHAILAALTRPMTALEIAQATGIHSNEVRTILRESDLFEVLGIDGTGQRDAQIWRVVGREKER